MNTRLQWFSLALSSASLRRIADGMQKREYSRRRSNGFRLSDVRRDYLSGRFIERVEWDDVVEDPASGELQVHRIEFRQLAFRLFGDLPNLEIFDAPRSLRSFLSALGESAGTDAIPEQIAVAPIEWLQEIEERAGKTVVNALTASGITLSAHASAAVRIVGTEDVRQHMMQLTGKKKAFIERLSVELPPPYAAKCELLPQGRALVPHAGEPTIKLLRQTLRSAVARRAG
jgi:hypothetical protein